MNGDYRPMKDRDEPHVIARRLAELEERVAKLEAKKVVCGVCDHAWEDIMVCCKREL